jgi:uncharacterized protein (DUF362 family)
MRIKRGPILIFVALTGLIGLDFAIWSQTPVSHTRWCEMTSWRYDANNVSTVSLIPSDYSRLHYPAALSDSLTYEQIAAMVQKALDLAAGGMNLLIPMSVHKIVIKPNIVEPGEVGKVVNGTGVDTDWRVIRALVLALYAFNPGFSIRVAEAAGGWTRPGTAGVKDWAKLDGYTMTGYKGMVESLKANPAYPGLDFDWVDLNYDDTVAVKIPEPRLSQDQTVFYLPRTLVEADYVIDVPVMKVHTTCVTVGLKNWVGILPGMVYGWSKNEGYNGNGIGLNHDADHIQKNIVELHRALHADLTLVDAIMCKEQSKYFSGISKRRNLIIAGTDVVSVDAVCSRLMGINPDDVEHISLAALAGLGQNNLDKIEITGGAIEHCAGRFIKSEKSTLTAQKNSSYPYYGQSNRVWIVRGGFPGADIDTDRLGGEAAAAPKPGQDGWSKALYFYDDLIDPAAVCQDSTNSVQYCYAWLDSPDSTAVQLWIGSGQEMALWLNGVRVYRYSGAPRTHYLPNTVVNATVKKGLNRILVKTVQRSGVSTFSLNVCENEKDSRYAGNRLSGAKFLASTEPERLPGDCNGDSKTDVFDLLALLKALSSGSQGGQYDQNSDGRVDVFDLLALLKTLGNR